MGDRKYIYNKNKKHCNMSKQDKYNDLMQTIKADEEQVKEQNRFDATLEQTRETHVLLQKSMMLRRKPTTTMPLFRKGLMQQP